MAAGSSTSSTCVSFLVDMESVVTFAQTFNLACDENWRCGIFLTKFDDSRYDIGFDYSYSFLSLRRRISESLLGTSEY